MTTTPTLLPMMEGLDWDDMAAVSAACHAAFASLTSDRWALLADLTSRVPADPHLAGMCEHYDFMDKVVIHDDPAGYRIRVHRFLPGYFDRPHNHRWSFGAFILTGSYQHLQYGADTDFENATPDSLQVLCSRTEQAGDWYVLHHTAVHSVAAEPGTLSLVLRGPAAKARFRILDAPANTSFHVRGAADETPAERAAKTMPPYRLTAAVEDVLAARPR
nr:hypothetical protein OH826_19460 [Streptomyces sp. NBC_00899]